MVSISLVQKSNSQVDESSAPRVAVFVGGTAGIGKITLAEIVALGTPIKAYVTGRKESEEAFKPTLEEWRQSNAKAEIIWVDGQVSLLKDVKKVCDHIKTLESKVDLLFMTPGYAPFAGRQDTSEGLDTAHALCYYSRICFVQNLLPLLRASGRARVISVHSGGMEYVSRINVDDLNLEKPGAYGAGASQMHMGIMNTLTLERLAEAKENQSIVFIHSHPGLVRTGNLYRGFKEGSWGSWIAAVTIDPVLMLFSFTFKESAERYLYLATSATFGGHGPSLPGVVGTTTKGGSSGSLFLSGWKCDTSTNEKELAKLRVTAQDAVWSKTYEILGPYI